MKNHDPYKRMVLFFSSLINIILLTATFGVAWFEYYSRQMFNNQTFYFKGNYVVLALYALLLVFFSKMYGGLKIGQLRRLEVMLSQMLSVFFVNVVTYLIVSLLAFALVNPVPLLIMMFVECVIIVVWTMLVLQIYNRLFQPWKILLIYGERPAEDLVYKVETRRDKYAIYDAINADEGIDVIAEKIKDFQAVMIGDISAEKRNSILKYCYGNGIRAYIMPKLSDIIMMGADRIHIFDTPLLLSKGYALSIDQRMVKRVMDCLIALVILIVTSPVMLVSALIIKCYDGGPVFYKQVRCTRDAREFSIYKFRSMVVNAESDGVAKLAAQNDERITPYGKFIRAVRIDELPQMFNILKGDMSFVGPRPERPEIIEEYTKEMPEFIFRMRVKAGLTGFAQVYGKYNTTPYDKLKLDMFYIENYSLWMDMKLIIMTVKTLLKKEATEGVEQGQTTAQKEPAKEEAGASVEELVQGIVNKS